MIRVIGLTADQVREALAPVRTDWESVIEFKGYMVRPRLGAVDVTVRGGWYGAPGYLRQHYKNVTMACDHVYADAFAALFAAGAKQVGTKAQEGPGEYTMYDTPPKAADINRVGTCRCVDIPVDTDGEYTPIPDQTQRWDGMYVRVKADHERGQHKFKAGQVYKVDAVNDDRIILTTDRGVSRWFDLEPFEIVLAPGEVLPEIPKVGQFFRATKDRAHGCNLRVGEVGQVARVTRRVGGGWRLYYRRSPKGSTEYYTVTDAVEFLDAQPEEWGKAPASKYKVGDIVAYDGRAKYQLVVRQVIPLNDGFDGYHYYVKHVNDPKDGDRYGTKCSERHLTSPYPADERQFEVGQYVKLGTSDYYDRRTGLWARGSILKIERFAQSNGLHYVEVSLPCPWDHNEDWHPGDKSDHTIVVHMTYLSIVDNFVPTKPPVDKPLAPGVQARVRKAVKGVDVDEQVILLERQWGEPATWAVRHNGVIRYVPEAALTRRPKIAKPVDRDGKKYITGDMVRILEDNDLRGDGADLDVGEVVEVVEGGRGDIYVKRDNGERWYVRVQYVEPYVKPEPVPVENAALIRRVYAQINDEWVAVSDPMHYSYCDNLYDEITMLRENGMLNQVTDVCIGDWHDERFKGAKRVPLYAQCLLDLSGRNLPTPLLDMANAALKGECLGSGAYRRVYLGADGWLYKKTGSREVNRQEYEVAKALRRLDLPDWVAIPEIEKIEGVPGEWDIIAAEYVKGKTVAAVHHNGCKCKEEYGLPECAERLVGKFEKEVKRQVGGKMYLSDLHHYNFMVADGKLWFVDMGNCEVNDKSLIAA